MQKVRFQGTSPRVGVSVPVTRTDASCRSKCSPLAGAQRLVPIKMIESPKLAAVCRHYDFYYAELDILRKCVREAGYICVPQRDSGIEESHNEEESHGPSPVQWPAEYLQRKFEARQYKLKVEKQLGLRPSSAEPTHRTTGLRSHGEEPHSQELLCQRKEMKDQEYWKQLEEIRQQYHHDVKEMRRRMRRQLEESSRISQKTYLVEKSALPGGQDAPEGDTPLQRGVKFEINLDECMSDGNTVREEEIADMQNETLTFEDGMKLKGHECLQEHEDNLDKAFENLRGPRAELFTQDAVAAENRRRWDARAPRTLLQMMAAADITSTCPLGPADGQVIVMEGVPDSRKPWRREAPGTLLSVLAAAHLTSNSFSSSEDLVGTLQQWLPKENVGKGEIASYTEADEELLEPASDNADTTFEESEDELRSESRIS